MLNVARDRDRPREVLRAGQRQTRVGGGLGCVDVEVARARVANVIVQHAGQYTVQALHVRVVEVPVAASLFQHEERNRVDDRDVMMVGVGLVHPAHGVRKGFIDFAPRCRVVVCGIPRQGGPDEGLFNCGRGARVMVRFDDCGVGIGRLLLAHATVQKGAQREGFAPPAHCARGVCAACFPH